MLDFGLKADEVRSLLGPPQRMRKNFFKEMRHFYEELIVTFSHENDQVIEITLSANSEVWIDKFNIFHDSEVAARLAETDGNPMQGPGVTVFLRLGISIGDLSAEGSDRTVSAFAKGRWDSHLHLLKAFPPQ